MDKETREDEERSFDVTRRDWLVTISGAAVAGLTVAEMEGAGAQPLPPGLYEASTDHLGHALMSAGRYRSIPEGCPTDYVRPRTKSYEPQYFSTADFAIIRRVTELLLGEMPENGGNKEIAQEVAEWIDLRVASAAGVRDAAGQLDPLYRAVAVGYYGTEEVDRLAKEDPEKTCEEGLRWLENESRERYGAAFLLLKEEQQSAMLQAMEEEAKSGNAGARFFEFMKAEVIRGFYTSQAGLKELGFKGNGYYAESPGCRRRE